MPEPPKLSANPKCEDWRYFRRQFENYILLAPVGKKAQVPLLEYCLGQDGINILDGLPEPKETKDEILARFDEYFGEQKSLILARREFLQSKQGQSETITEYACRLRRLYKECEYDTQNDELMRDVFVIGIANNDIAEKLMAKEDLDFNEAVSRGEAWERATRTRQETVKTINLAKTEETEDSSGICVIEKRCYRCGSNKHLANSKICPARTQQCRKCKKVGHYQKVCRGREIRVANIYAGNGAETMRKVKIDGKDTNVLLDTGASYNVLPLKMVTESEIHPTTVKLRAWGNFDLPVVGELVSEIEYKGRKMKAKFIIVNCDRSPPLLSLPVLQELLLINEFVTEVNVCEQYEVDFYREFADVFEGNGFMKNHQCSVSLIDGCKPVAIPSRRLPPALMPSVKEELDRMIALGIIEETSEPSDWCAPLVIARRKNGKIRLCTDFRELNKVVRRELYQIPAFEDLIATIHKACVFTLLDCSNGYWQMPVKEGSREILTFASPFGRYRYARLPFGLKSAPEIFQKAMHEILHGLPGVVVYIDDILIYAHSEKEHDERLKEVLRRLKSEGVTLNKEKCHLKKNYVEFLGHEFTASGIKVATEKTKAIREMSQPSSREQLRSFLGLTTYVGQKFIPHYSSIVVPLWELCAEDTSFEWTEERLKAFQNIKHEVEKVTSLAWLNPEETCLIQVDASGVGLGAVLLQKGKPIIYASRKLTETEVRYSQLEKEFLAIVFAVKRFRRLIIGTRCSIETDHQPILRLMEKRIDQLPVRIQRWMLAIQAYDLPVKHISGKANVLADALSRNAVNENMDDDESAEEMVCMAVEGTCQSSDLAARTADDSKMQRVKEAIENGWKKPQFKKLQPYYGFRHELWIQQEVNSQNFVIWRHSVPVIPTVMRRAILSDIHEGHMGIKKTKATLRSLAYWPGMNRTIEEMIRACDACVTYQRNADVKKPEVVANTETIPWRKIAIDLTGPSDVLQGRTLLTVIDYFSRYPEVFTLRSATSKNIIISLKELFARLGVPEILVSDNGTVFRSAEFEEFLTSMGIKHHLSSNYYPQANGVIERFHGTLKGRLQKIAHEHRYSFEEGLRIVLRDIRSTPNDMTGETPFHRMFGREMRTRIGNMIPGHRPLTVPARDTEKEYSKMKESRVHRKYKTGDQVKYRLGRGKPFMYEGIILSQVRQRTFKLKTANGVRIVNQYHLRPIVKHTYNLRN